MLGNNSITSSTVGQWLLILLVALSIPLVMETLKNLWLNWGWSHPYVSSVIVAFVAIAAWWIFGGIVTLAAPQSRAPVQSESPATPQKIEQSATASGGSTINQAGRDVVINQGVPESTVREILKQKLVSEHEELSAKYPAGYVILGIANGAIIQEAKLKDVQFRADWNNFLVTIDESTRQVRLKIAELYYRAPSRSHPLGFRNCIEVFPFTENTPVRSGYVPDMYYEVLDASKPIFLIGFK